MLFEVCLDEFSEREFPRDPLLSSKPFQLMIKRVARVLLGSEAATLHALRVAAAGPVAIRPQPLAAGSAKRQFECLSLLHHRFGSLLSGVDPLLLKSFNTEARAG